MSCKCLCLIDKNGIHLMQAIKLTYKMEQQYENGLFPQCCFDLADLYQSGKENNRL